VCFLSNFWIEGQEIKQEMEEVPPSIPVRAHLFNFGIGDVDGLYGECVLREHFLIDNDNDFSEATHSVASVHV